eukprot:364483-Chlamydomonas_euryale.AAC.5
MHALDRHTSTCTQQEHVVPVCVLWLESHTWRACLRLEHIDQAAPKGGEGRRGGGNTGAHRGRCACLHMNME